MSVTFYCAECHYAECHYAEWNYTECRYTVCHYAEYRSAHFLLFIASQLNLYKSNCQFALELAVVEVDFCANLANLHMSLNSHQASACFKKAKKFYSHEWDKLMQNQPLNYDVYMDLNLGLFTQRPILH